MIYWNLNGERYPYVPLADMTPRDIMALQLSLADAEYTTIHKVDEAVDLIRSLHQMPKSERRDHPEFRFCTLVQLWAAIRSTGSRMTFDEMLDVPLNGIEFVVERDDEAGEGEGKALPPSGSGGGNRAARRKKKSGQ